VDPELAALVPTYLSGDFAEIAGQGTARTAAEIRAAGGHNLSLLGPPGSGAVLLAERLPTILPDLDRDAALEVSAIHATARALRLRTGARLLDRSHPMTTFGTADRREGIRAFIDKREPQFHGE
jgi:magnesium chelatase family protein